MTTQETFPTNRLNETYPLYTEDNSPVWHTGFILRVIPKEVAQTPEDRVIPIRVFYCPKTGKILSHLIPEEIRGDYEAYSMNDLATPPPTTTSYNEETPEIDYLSWD